MRSYLSSFGFVGMVRSATSPVLALDAMLPCEGAAARCIWVNVTLTPAASPGKVLTAQRLTNTVVPTTFLRIPE
jgi:hypothetical protein